MTTTAEQLAAINDAILQRSRGVTKYRAPDGSETQYASLSDLLKAKAELEVIAAGELDGVYHQTSFGRPE